MEGLPKNESIERNIEADLEFLSKYKDTDKLSVLELVPGGEVAGGSGHEMEPVIVQGDDEKVWDTRTVKELRELALECKTYDDMVRSDYPLAFKDPTTEEEHQSAIGKLS